MEKTLKQVYREWRNITKKVTVARLSFSSFFFLKELSDVSGMGARNKKNDAIDSSLQSKIQAFWVSLNIIFFSYCFFFFIHADIYLWKGLGISWVAALAWMLDNQWSVCIQLLTWRVVSLGCLEFWLFNFLQWDNMEELLIADSLQDISNLYRLS